MSPTSVRCLLVSALFAASACSSTDTHTTSRSAQLTAPTANPTAPSPPAPNPPGPNLPPTPPAPNPPGPMPSPAPPLVNPPAPNPPGPTPPVLMPGYVIAGAPMHHRVTRGVTATFIVSLRSRNGFRGRVTMSARILPYNGLWPGSDWSRQPVTLAPNATATSTLTIVTTSATPFGTHTITLEGRAGDIQETATLLLTVR